MNCLTRGGDTLSSTATVAIFVRVVFKVAGKTGLKASRRLLPMSYAAMISGMLTLIVSPSSPAPKFARMPLALTRPQSDCAALTDVGDYNLLLRKRLRCTGATMSPAASKITDVGSGT